MNFGQETTPGEDDDDLFKLDDFGDSSSDDETQDKSLLDASIDMEFDSASLTDKEMQVEGGGPFNRKK